MTTKPKTPLFKNPSTNNAIKLSQLHPAFRKKVQAILKDLEGHGWRPYIVEGWRSVEEQERLFREKRTKVRFGFHNITGKNGRPESFAVDIVDAYLGYNAPKAFWLMLASSALAHECESGVLWTGANILLKRRILQAIKNREFHSYNGNLGWDCAHVQMYPSSMLKKLKEGWRP